VVLDFAEPIEQLLLPLNPVSLFLI